MRLYLLRHGHSPTALDAKVSSDAERPLSERGRDEVKKSVAEILRRGGRPALILHSPLSRAEETAALAKTLIRPAPQISVFQPLANILPASELREELNRRVSGSLEVLAVGHQPQLGDFAALLCGRVFDMRTAGVVAIEVGKDLSAALWFYNPQDAAPEPAPPPRRTR